MSRSVAALVVLALGVLLSFVDAPYPRYQWLHHVPTVPALVALFVVARRRALSDASLLCIVAFLALHTIGARWIYSFVPYDEWLVAWTGTDTAELLGWERNHYDRLVHLAFGVFAVPPVVEWTVTRWRLTRARAAIVAWLFVLGVSAIYEVFEWGLAMSAAPETAESYNGQQGDAWDAQKDMALAAFGALPALPWAAARSSHTGETT